MYWTYLRRELRRRSKQAIVVALGLGLGIGLVMTVSAATAGVKTAQASVLHSLYGIGTDITVSKTAAAGTAGPLHFGGFGSPSSTSRPAAGTKISRNTLRPTPGEATLSAADVTGIRGMHEVDAAAGGLVLTDTSFSGTIPSFSPGSFAGAPLRGAPRPAVERLSTSAPSASTACRPMSPASAPWAQRRSLPAPTSPPRSPPRTWQW